MLQPQRRGKGTVAYPALAPTRSPAGPLGISLVLHFPGSFPRPAHHLRSRLSLSITSVSAPFLPIISQVPPLFALPIISGPSPARFLPRVPQPSEGRQGSLRLSVHFLPSFPPRAAVGARVKQGDLRAHHGKSEPATSAPPGFGAAGCASGQAPRAPPACPSPGGGGAF